MRHKNNKAETADSVSAMREVWLTSRFLNNISQICKRVVDADDEQLQILIKMAIDMSDQGLTDWVTDEIQFATFGIGNELTTYFIADDIYIGKQVVRKYTFIAAIADDVEIIRNSTSGKFSILKRLSSLTVKSTVAYRVYKAVEEAISEALES